MPSRFVLALSYYTVHLTRRTGIVGLQVISAIHRRFPTTFTPRAVTSLSVALAAPSRASVAGLPPEQREKEDAARVAKQRPILRVCSELALVGIIRDAPGRSGGEWIMKVLKELVRCLLSKQVPTVTDLWCRGNSAIERSFAFLSATPDYFPQIILSAILGYYPATALESHY